ncbi:MAG: mannose-6-phosphate isomerase [Deltaproteobacteria bacterium CG11_big_fil_rev_8_21_14_0_20_45_16]|nr:MAG: mannose-6-phosphate isomerase [Deltaproteobacteria bacterium CG11_big_fil_rev_8_21_14_0_20_45_16]
MIWTEQRPWGRFKNLFENEITKVKLIEVDQEKRLSYQSHRNRQEHWMILKGKALVTLDGRDVELNTGQAFDIPQEAKHRIQNIGQESLQLIEIQIGSSFDEKDITRYEDDFGRS